MRTRVAVRPSNRALLCLVMLAAVISGCDSSRSGAAAGVGATGSSTLVAELPEQPVRAGELVPVAVKVGLQGAQVAGYALNVQFDAASLELQGVFGEPETPLWSPANASTGSFDLVQARGGAPVESMRVTLSFRVLSAAVGAAPLVIGAAAGGGVVSAADYRLSRPEPVSGLVSVVR